MRKESFATYAQKMRQANREAKATLVAFGIIVAAWLVGGIGLSGVDVTVFGTPLWAVVGTLGTWAVAIACAVVLSKRAFKDFSLEDDGLAAPAADGDAAAGAPVAGDALAPSPVSASANPEAGDRRA